MVTEAFAPEGFGRKDYAKYHQRFVALRDERLQRFTALLQPLHRDIVDILPLLFHQNHPLLPGFVSTNTPCGIANYTPLRHEVLAAKKFARSFTLKKQARRRYPIRAVYLMGSIGTLGQEVASDMDIWLCHAGNLGEEGLRELEEKARRIEVWAESQGADLHIFLMHAEAFRDGEALAISHESSGSIQHHLLLDEFYRSNLLLAGLPPLWWIISPEKEPEYRQYTGGLVAQRFIKQSNWLDFGGLETVDIQEFFGAAYWQLHKALDAPYKALLKLFLIETYVAEYPAVRWLSQLTKERIYRDESATADTLDPYLIMLELVSEYLARRGEHDRIALLQRAFYIKAGQQLSGQPRHPGWKFDKIRQLVKEWGWSPQVIKDLDSRYNWKLERVIEERNRVAAELSRSYRMLTEHSRLEMAPKGIERRELALLGRKLYAALERRPGKIDFVNPGVSGNLEEPELWISHNRKQAGGKWFLYRHKPAGDHKVPMKATNSLVEMIAWIRVNGLASTKSQIHLHAPDLLGNGLHLQLVRSIGNLLKPGLRNATDFENFAHSPSIHRARLFINMEPEARAGDDRQLTSERDDPLSYGGTHECLITRLDNLMITSWGEVLVHSHGEGAARVMNCLCQILNMLPPEAGQHKLPVDVEGAANTRGRAFAKRFSGLLEELWEAYLQHGEAMRYLLRIRDRFYLLATRRQQDKTLFDWQEAADQTALMALLGEPPAQACHTHIDAQALPESPIGYLLRRFEPGNLQLYYRPQGNSIEYFLMDEHGAIYRQSVPGAQDKHFITQQQRFLHSLLTRQMVITADGAPLQPEQQVLFYRLQGGPGDWQASPVRAGIDNPGSYTDMTLSTGPHGPWVDGFSLILGNQEFSSLILGDMLYDEVAAHLKSLRHGDGCYPAYLTGVICTGLEQSERWPIGEMLAFKHILEARLSEALCA